MLRACRPLEPVERVGYGPGQAVPAGERLPERIPGADIGDKAGTYKQRARGELHRNQKPAAKPRGTIQAIPFGVRPVLRETAGRGRGADYPAYGEQVPPPVGYEGEIRWDPSKPNGTPRKLLDVSKAAALGWSYKTELEEGIRFSYQDFLKNPIRAER